MSAAEIVECARRTPDKEVVVSRHRCHLRSYSPFALLVAIGVVVLVSTLAGCGSKGDFPGSYQSVRGEKVQIAARADGDYDVTFVDRSGQGQDMTFPLKRSGKRLTYEDEDFFIYVTLNGDSVTIERIGNIQTFARQK